MADTAKFSRTMAYALSGAIALTALQPAVAGPLPMSRDMSAAPVVESVQYRRGRPAYAARRKGGGNGAVAAAIIGAVAIGAAAIAASNAEKRRQRRAEAYYYGSAPYGYGYAAEPYYAPQEYVPQVQYYPAGPQYYDRNYQYRQPAARWRGQAAPRVDGGSPYAVQPHRQRTVQPGWGGGRYYGEAGQRVGGIQ